MRAGTLDQRVTLERQQSGVDELGQPFDDWTTVATVWASVQPLVGREFIAAQAVQSEVTTRVVIRYMAGLTAADRVLHNGRVYEVTAVMDVRSQHDELVLMCRG